MTTPAIAILGCAHIHMHDVAAAMSDRQDVHCAAVWDPNPNRAYNWAERLGAERATSPAEACDHNGVKAAAILSETCDHEALVRAAVEADKDVFVEKPLAMTGEAASRIADAVARSGQRFDTGYFLRDVPAIAQLRRLVREGSIGRVERLRGRFSREGARLGWFEDCAWVLDAERAGYGALGDLGIHLLDLVTWTLDTEITEVRAAAHRIDEAPGVDQYGVGVLRLEGGARADLFASWVDPQDDVMLEVTGTEGRAWVERGRLRVAARDRGEVSEVPVAAPSAGTALGRVLDTLCGRPSPNATSVRTAAHHCELIDALYHSAASDAWIAVRRSWEA